MPNASRTFYFNEAIAGIIQGDQNVFGRVSRCLKTLRMEKKWPQQNDGLVKKVARKTC